MQQKPMIILTGPTAVGKSALSVEQAKKIRQHREEKTLTKEIVRLLVIGERKKKTTVTLKQDEIKKYFPPEYDEQKIRTVICQLLEEWSNQNH